MFDSRVSFVLCGVIGVLGVPAAAQQSPLSDNVTLYWADFGLDMIRRTTANGGPVENLLTTGLNTPVAVALAPGKRWVYWADQETFSIGRIDTSSGLSQVIISSFARQSQPLGVAVGGGKVYWTEWCDSGCETSSIRRANLDGTDAEILLDNTIVPTMYFVAGITLDLSGGKMYWTDLGVWRANTDGSNPKLLVSFDQMDGMPWDITLDVAGGHMYWVEKGGPVRRADLDGSNVEALPGTLGGEGIGLDLIARKVYWTMGARISRANLDGTNIETVVESGLSVSGLDLDVHLAVSAVPALGTYPLVASGLLLVISGSIIVFCVRRRALPCRFEKS